MRTATYNYLNKITREYNIDRVERIIQKASPNINRKDVMELLPVLPQVDMDDYDEEMVSTNVELAQAIAEEQGKWLNNTSSTASKKKAQLDDLRTLLVRNELLTLLIGGGASINNTVNGLVATIIFNGLKVNSKGETKSTYDIRTEIADRLKIGNRQSNPIIARAVQTSTTEAAALGVKHELDQQGVRNWEWIV